MWGWIRGGAPAGHQTTHPMLRVPIDGGTMKRLHIRKLSSVILVFGLFAGTSVAVASPGFATTQTTKKFKTIATFATTTINPDGSFSAPLAGTGPKGATSSSTLAAVTTQGPKSITKTKVVLTAVPVGGTGVANGYSATISSPWLVGTLSGTVSPPTGYGPPATLTISVNCVCNWSARSWTWTVTIKWTSAASA